MTRSHWSSKLVLSLVVLSGIGLPSASLGLEQDVAVRFLPPVDSDLQGYQLYLTEVATGFEEVLDLGLPTAGADGVATAVVEVDADRAYVIELTAYNAAGESSRSNPLDVDVVGCDDDDDGLANRCDCDYDQDGSCTVHDFVDVFLPCFQGASGKLCETADHTCDADGKVNAVDFTEGFLPGFQAGIPCP